MWPLGQANIASSEYFSLFEVESKWMRSFVYFLAKGQTQVPGTVLLIRQWEFWLNVQKN